MLSGAREQLAPLSESRSDVINKHQIRLLTILIDRQQRKLKRLEQERGETQALIAGLDKKAADLHREYCRLWCRAWFVTIFRSSIPKAFEI